MKVISDSRIGEENINWLVSIVCLGKDASAQVVVCDPANQLQNIVCIMCQTSTPVNTVVLDLAENQALVDDSQSEDQFTAVELAKLLGSKLCRKTGLPQIFLSLNISIE